MALGFPKLIDGVSTSLVAPSDLGSAEAADQLRFARELHDQVAQPLIGLLLEIRELRATRGRQAGVDTELTRIEDSTRQVLRQAREIMIDLRESSGLRLSLVEALKNELPIPQGRELRLQVSSRWPHHVNGWAAFNLLRIIQQAVANAWRHGSAQRVDVVLGVGPDDDEAVVVVIDDGIGIDGQAQYGFGMVGMDERAVILNGRLTARRLEKGGTRVEVRVPAGSLA